MVAGPDVRKVLGGVHVLVVDVDASARNLLCEVLTYGGARVTEATSARNALAVVAAHRPDVIVASLAMPGEDGYWLAQALRSQSAARDTPLVALGGRPEDDADRATSAGFDAYASKPVDPWELCRMLASVVRKA